MLTPSRALADRVGGGLLAEANGWLLTELGHANSWALQAAAELAVERSPASSLRLRALR